LQWLASEITKVRNAALDVFGLLELPSAMNKGVREKKQ
jgi:hypothetical protein